jgi:DNA excision repair protein ERCC-2
MPTGTGKTISLLSLVMSWILAHRTPENPFKLIYCCRTIGEVDKTLEELRRLWNYIVNTIMDDNPTMGADTGAGDTKSTAGEAPAYLSAFLALSLSSRKSLCINPAANTLGKRAVIDAKCHDLTSPEMRELWRNKHGSSSWRAYQRNNDEDRMDVDQGESSAQPREAESLCQYYENFISATGGESLLGNRRPANTSVTDIEDITNDNASAAADSESPLHAIRGIYSLDELTAVGKARGVCPYYMARYLIPKADVVVYSYQYLLNPRIHQIVSQQLRGDAIVIFDEAHNIGSIVVIGFLHMHIGIRFLIDDHRQCLHRSAERKTQQSWRRIGNPKRARSWLSLGQHETTRRRAP